MLNRHEWLLLALGIAAVECCMLPYTHYARHFPSSASATSSGGTDGGDQVKHVLFAISLLLAGGCALENIPLAPLEEGQTTAERLNSRGFALLRRACREKPDDGAFVSPYSIDSAFGLAWLAAKGKTKEEIANGLGFPEDCRETFRRLHEAFTSTGDAELLSANAVWTAPNVHVNDAVASDMRSCFGGEIRTVDFTRSDKATAAINAFVSDCTRGKISTAVDSVDEQTRLMLVNALYFKAKWYDEFNKNATRQGMFTLTNGRTKSVWMMHSTRHVSYYHSNGLEAIFLPYKNRRFQFAVILPEWTKGIDGLLERLENGDFTNVVQRVDTKELHITLPKIDREFRTDLGRVLPKMGVKTAFDRDCAQFPGWKDGEGDSLCVQRACHVTKLHVDEVATEASAATLSYFRSVGIPMDFTVNRPFIAVIYDIKTQLVLFAGVINDPGTHAPAVAQTESGINAFGAISDHKESARESAVFDKAFLVGASQNFSAIHDKSLYERYRRMDGITFEMAGGLQSDQYIGRSSVEIREAFEADWKKAGSVDPELARQEKRLDELEKPFYHWLFEEIRKEADRPGVRIPLEDDEIPRPPEIAKIERKINELKEKISVIRGPGDGREAVLEKYRKLLFDDLPPKIDEFIKDLDSGKYDEKFASMFKGNSGDAVGHSAFEGMGAFQDNATKADSAESKGRAEKCNALDFWIPFENGSAL